MAGILVSCGNDMSDIRAFAADANAPIEVSTDVTMQLSDDGVVRYVLETPRIEKYLVEEQEVYKFPIGFLLTTYDTLGVQATRISAKQGEMKQTLGEITLRDSVRMINTSQESLETDLLYVFIEQDSIYTDQPVTVSSLSGRLTGKFGLTSNLNFTEYQMNKVDGEIETREIYNQDEQESEQSEKPR